MKLSDKELMNIAKVLIEITEVTANQIVNGTYSFIHEINEETGSKDYKENRLRESAEYLEELEDRMKAIHNIQQLVNEGKSDED